MVALAEQALRTCVLMWTEHDRTHIPADNDAGDDGSYLGDNKKRAKNLFVFFLLSSRKTKSWRNQPSIKFNEKRREK
jgi:hypothetical protein